MFRSRITFPFSRIFRLRSRRPSRENASSTVVARRASSGPSPTKSRRPVSLQLEPIDTTCPPSTPQPPVFTQFPGETPTRGSSIPIIVIGDGPAQSTPPPLPIPALSDHIKPQIYLDGVMLLESPPAQTHIGTRHVSFQVPTTRMEDLPESPLSTCSTLVSHEAESDSVAPMEPLVTPEAADSTSDCVVPAEPDAELNDVVHSESGRARHKSLFVPQPVRSNMGRSSMPPPRAAPNMTTRTNARDSRRESKRVSAMPVGSGSGSARRDKRKSRWSREMSKPETQEVLRALSGI